MGELENNKKVAEIPEDGELYNSTDPALYEKQWKMNDLMYEFNHTRPSDRERLKEILKELLGSVGENCVIEKAIIAEDTVIENDVSIGIGSEVPNKMKPNIYSGGLATIGENSVIPGGVQIGKNTAISGVTSSEDYIDGVLASGETLIKAGDRV